MITAGKLACAVCLVPKVVVRESSPRKLAIREVQVDTRSERDLGKSRERCVS